MSNIADVASKIKTFLEGVSGVSVVSDRPGGVMAWVSRRRPEQSYVEIDVPSVSRQGAEIGTQGFRTYRAKIDVFLPFSYENPNSAVKWRALVDAICSQLESNRSLGGTVSDVGLPQVSNNALVGVKTGGNPSEVVCHHCTIECTVRDYYSYTTA